jgi:hypothetical protein
LTVGLIAVDQREEPGKVGLRPVVAVEDGIIDAAGVEIEGRNASAGDFGNSIIGREPDKCTFLD